jgi:hypothetical protein
MELNVKKMLEETLEKMRLRIEAADQEWETENNSKTVTAFMTET